MTPEEQTLFGIDKLNVVRFDIPAVTHVDYSARIQTVHANTNPLFHRLLKRFKALTGCAVLVNHELNDLLVVGRCVVYKAEQGIR